MESINMQFTKMAKAFPVAEIIKKLSSNQHTAVPVKLLLGPQILNREDNKSQWLYN